MIMKTFKYLLAVILTVGTMISCEMWPDRQVFEGSGLGAVTNLYELPDEGTEIHVDVISTMQYDIICNADWLSTPAVSQDRDGFKVRTETNIGLSRQTTIILAIEKTSHYDTVTVFQNGTTTVTMLKGTEEGTETIALNSEANDCELEVKYYNSDQAWISDYAVAGNDITFTYSQNTTASPRFASIIISYIDGTGKRLSHPFDIIQSNPSDSNMPSSYVDLTEGEKWANSYILSESDATTYCVEPKHVSGTGMSDRVRTAELLWETEPGIFSNVVYNRAENKIIFDKKASAKGNAVIAVKNFTGTVIWSYHLWASGENVGEIEVGGYKFLDRNIGALSNTAPVDVESDAAGLYYQWGRKDPFPGPVNLKSSNGVKRDVYPNVVEIESQQNGVTLETTIQNPAIYYWGSSNSGKEDWSSVQNDSYWNTEAKTDFDPCPYGYVVPDDLQVAALIAAKSSAATYGYVLNCKINGENSTNYLCSGGWYRRSYSSSYPNSQLAQVGQPHYWSTTSQGNGDKHLSYATETISELKARERRWGCTIRCVTLAQPVQEQPQE